MLDLARYRELKIAPRAVFDALAERRTRPRFMVRRDGDWHSVTWQAFADELRWCALFLATLGLERGERAAIFAGNRVEWMSAALGIQAAGGVLVPIYPASTAEQAAYVAEHSDARFVFVDSAALLARVLLAWPRYSAARRVVLLDPSIDAVSVLTSLRAEGREVPSTQEALERVVHLRDALAIGRARDEEDGAAFEARMAQVALSDPGLMLYTSGTTGNPKGVPLTHANVAVNGRDWLECNGPMLDEGVVDLLWLPMSHIFGFGEACLGNTLGLTTYLSDPREVLAHLPEVRPEIFMSVPAYWEKLAQQALAVQGRDERRRRLAEVTGGKLRFCLSGGAGLKREVKEVFYESGLLIIEGYGLTETSPTLTLNRPGAFRFDSVGKPLPSVELRLAEDGEILARGPSVFGGYHKDPEATAAAFTEDGWLMTGDVGRFTDDGFLQIVDRKKEILVTAGGKNVPPANIEQGFADEPLVSHVVVYGDGKKYLVAGIWLDHEAVDAELERRETPRDERARVIEALVGELVAKRNASLASFEQIKRWRLMDTPAHGGLGPLDLDAQGAAQEGVGGLRARARGPLRVRRAAEGPARETGRAGIDATSATRRERP
jgi:long-chain acyl-CoA synthetase